MKLTANEKLFLAIVNGKIRNPPTLFNGVFRKLSPYTYLTRTKLFDALERSLLKMGIIYLNENNMLVYKVRKI